MRTQHVVGGIREKAGKLDWQFLRLKQQKKLDESFLGSNIDSFGALAVRLVTIRFMMSIRLMMTMKLVTMIFMVTMRLVTMIVVLIAEHRDHQLLL